MVGVLAESLSWWVSIGDSCFSSIREISSIYEMSNYLDPSIIYVGNTTSWSFPSLPASMPQDLGLPSQMNFEQAGSLMAHEINVLYTFIFGLILGVLVLVSLILIRVTLFKGHTFYNLLEL